VATISVPALLFGKRAIASIDEQGNNTIANDTNMAATTATTTGITGPTIGNSTSQRVAVGGRKYDYFDQSILAANSTNSIRRSVAFFAPNGSTEVHNVIFDQSNGTTTSDIGVPFTLPPGVSQEAPTDVSQELLPALPYNLGEPIIQNTSTASDGTTQVIVGFNKIAFYPSVVDQYGNVGYLEGEEEFSSQIGGGESSTHQEMFMLANLSTSYTMDSTETLVSSGIILDVRGFAELNEGAVQEQQATTATGEGTQILTPPYPLMSSFTVTFSESGTYNYFCAFHPAMFGQVIVR